MSDMLEMMGQDIWNDARRLTIRGSAELANALFNGSAFVPYGPGQFIKAQQHKQEQAGHDQAEMARENDGRDV